MRRFLLRFRWYRRIAGIPEPKPLSMVDFEQVFQIINERGERFGANVNKDY